ncbi:uncharacterized protein PRCAT00000765001 [Priceomyces carsonii]|uniref:uncharacterized protein n=1 Tax=Priceomyces carsonii TaxID=28549 RepID=UPI002ED7E67F|nr:unnamed protein product [Priceomyces carsonii]
MKILCVAEKPSIAKEVSNILGGGRLNVRNSRNKYIKNYDFTFNFPRVGVCNVTMTSVAGHIMNIDFPQTYQWGKCIPGRLLDAPIIEKISRQDIYDNISKEARNSDKLMIWTDCDREGEYIGFEIFQAAQKGNGRLTVEDTWRSQFSHLERSHILNAARNPIILDMNSVNAVKCRMEIDLRIGASFTRYITDALKQGRVIERGDVASYGTCQFPTLGFVVDRYKRVKNFIPESFWYITLEIKKDNKKTSFNWTKNHLFDRLYVTLLYQQCVSYPEAQVIKTEQKRTTNWRPLPLTTVELQKDCAKFFKMSAKRTLDAAEKLYNSGFISYPRTETDSFPDSMDFRGTISKQTQDERWGSYAQGILGEGLERPRNGKHNDKAHPAIHPVKYAKLENLESLDQKKVYEYVVRRFLACCSKDAVGQLTTATLGWGPETFTASGLIVQERNYLDVYPYRKWETTKQLPILIEGEMIKVSSGLMKEGKTAPPKHMTEPELIALMDANGIGTDATIAEHIDKIVSRKYVVKAKQSSVEYIVPSPLGMGLIEGFSQMEFDDVSLSKPFLRKELEMSLQQIVEGSQNKESVLQAIIGTYKRAYVISQQKSNVLVQACRLMIQENS